MKRFIAKFLIQWYADGPNSSLGADRLPQWLRRWVDNDPCLIEYEQQLISLEQSLTKQSAAFASNASLPSSPHSQLPTDFVVQNARSSRSVWTMLALAASLLCVVYVGTKMFNRPNDPGPTQIATAEDSPKNSVQEKKKYQDWIRSTVDISKRLKSKVQNEGAVASNKLKDIQHSMQADQQYLASVSRNGIKFVGQKLPAATVRMLGMSDR